MTNRRRRHLIGGLLLASMSTSGAAGDFLGLISEHYLHPEWEKHGYDASKLVTHRVYAWFSGHPEDRVIAVYGTHRKFLQLVSYDGQFHNPTPPWDSLTAPLDLRPANIWLNQWDTYVTIGTDTATNDATQLSPGFAEETGGLTGDVLSDDVAWYVTAEDEQGRPVDGLVLLGQFTTPVETSGCGIVNVTIEDRDGVREIAGQQFGYLCPYLFWSEQLDVIYGRDVTGTRDELCESDDAVLGVRAVAPVSPTAPSVAIEFDAVSPGGGCCDFGIEIEASCDAIPSLVTQRIYFWNFFSSHWDLVDERLATADDSIATIRLKTASVYMDGRDVRARLEYHEPSTLAALEWGVRLDRVAWSVLARVP